MHRVLARYRVLAGETAIDPALVESLLHGANLPEPVRLLSEREREVLALMAEGLTDRGMAQRLHVSPRTVASHVRSIFHRLGLPDTPADNRRVHAVLTLLRTR